jgi:hypothetical protein
MYIDHSVEEYRIKTRSVNSRKLILFQLTNDAVHLIGHGTHLLTGWLPLSLAVRVALIQTRARLATQRINECVRMYETYKCVGIKCFRSLSSILDNKRTIWLTTTSADVVNQD